MRYRGAAGGAEKAHSRQRHWCLWSKPVNLGTWGLVPGPIAMAHAFAELGYGTWYTLAKTVSDVGTFWAIPFTLKSTRLPGRGGRCATKPAKVSVASTLLASTDM